MSAYTRCPTCNKLLSIRRIPLRKQMEELYTDNSLSPEEKLDKKQQIIESLQLNPCCINRFITELDKINILIT